MSEDRLRELAEANHVKRKLRLARREAMSGHIREAEATLPNALAIAHASIAIALALQMLVEKE